MFRCTICRHLHRTTTAAKRCCPPYAREVWVCTTCEKQHILLVDAAYCCSTGEPQKLP